MLKLNSGVLRKEGWLVLGKGLYFSGRTERIRFWIYIIVDAIYFFFLLVSLFWSFVCIIALKSYDEWAEDISRADRLWCAALIFRGKATKRLVRTSYFVNLTPSQEAQFPITFSRSSLLCFCKDLSPAEVRDVGLPQLRGPQGNCQSGRAGGLPSGLMFFTSQVMMLWFHFLLAALPSLR